MIYENRKSLIGILCALWLTVGGFPAMLQSGIPLQPTAASAQTESLNSSITTLVNKLITSAEGDQIGKLAVADFIGPGNTVTALGDYISDKVSVAVFTSGAFPGIMERKQLKELLREIQKGHSDLLYPQSVTEFGRLIGVDGMVIGTIKDLGMDIDVTVKIVESETGRSQGMADVRLAKDETVKGLLYKPRTATLTITVDPVVGGAVEVCEQEGIMRNGSITLSEIPYGECRVVIQAQGYASVRKMITIRSPQEALSVVLERKQYEVSFQILPPDAALTVDGRLIKLNPQGFSKITDLQAREYSYVVRARGFQTKIDRFNPVRDELITLDLATDDPFYDTKNKFFQKVQHVIQQRDFSVRLWTNRATFQLGDAIYFYFETERDCYLNLVDITSEGDIRLIFPNRFQSDNFVRGGITYRIPGENGGFVFEAEPPTGIERIYAIASKGPLKIFSHDFTQEDVYTVTRGSKKDVMARGIGIKLESAELNAAAEWVINIR